MKLLAKLEHGKFSYKHGKNSCYSYCKMLHAPINSITEIDATHSDLSSVRPPMSPPSLPFRPILDNFLKRLVQRVSD